MSRLRPQLTYANVVSTICLCLLVGGGAAIAAGHLGKNTVGPKQLKKNAVTTAKVKNEAITGAKVKKGTLTGTQIDAATLGTVPNAAHASSAEQAVVANQASAADTVGGLSVTKFEQTGVVKEQSPVTLVNLGGLQLKYSCETAAPDEMRLRAFTEVDGAGLWLTRSYPPGGASFEEVVPFNSGNGNGITLYGSIGTGVYTSPIGRVVTFTYHESIGFCKRGVAGTAYGG
jgi:hypothetical protein